MSDPNLIRAFLEQASAKGSKSTVLKPLGGMMAICISASLSAVYFKSPSWLLILFSIFAGCTMSLYLIAFLYCLFNDRDALRSESYTIQKMAIEKGFVGDSNIGIIPLENINSKSYIESSSVDSEDER